MQPPSQLPAPDATATACSELQTLPIRQQLCSLSFFHIWLFFAIHFWRYVWLLGTLVEQMEDKGDSKHGYSKAAGWVLPAAALLLPFVGLFLDEFGFARGFFFVTLCGVLYSGLVMFSSLGLQVPSPFFLTIISRRPCFEQHLEMAGFDPMILNYSPERLLICIYVTG